VGALFGFWGPPDRDLLEALARNLRHRGCGRPRFIERAWGSLGVDAPAGDVPSPDDDVAVTGLWSDTADFAIAGRPVPGPAVASVPTRRELAARWRASGTEIARVLGAPWIAAVLEPTRLVLLRDQVGMRSLVWARHAGRVVFASEPKGLWQLARFPRRISAPSLAQYLACSFVPAPATMLADVLAVPCGHAVEIDDHATRTSSTFDLATIAIDEACDEDAWVERIRGALGRAVEDRLPRDGEVAVFLSGGLDSSVVAAEVARRARGGVRTYSIHFGAGRANELDFARQVAERLGTVHEEVELAPTAFMPRFREVAWHLDDPIGDPITVPNFELSRKVAATVRHAFNGEGGDPVLGGPKNLPMLVSHWYGGVDHGPGTRERNYLASFRRAFDEIDRLLLPDMRQQIDVERDLLAPLTPLLHGDHPATLLGKLQVANVRLKGAQLILPKVERMTSAANLVVASPLFDARLVEVAFAMPGRMKLRDGIEKWIMKRAWRDALPAAVIDRPKSWMRVPVHDCFKAEMRPMAQALLSPRRLAQGGIWNPARVAQILDYDVDQPGGRFGLKLWMLLAFETWRSLVIDGESP